MFQSLPRCEDGLLLFTIEQFVVDGIGVVIDGVMDVGLVVLLLACSGNKIKVQKLKQFPMTSLFCENSTRHIFYYFLPSSMSLTP